MIWIWWWTPRGFDKQSERFYNDYEAPRVPTKIHAYNGDPWNEDIPSLCGRYPGDEPFTRADYPRDTKRIWCQTCVKIGKNRKGA